MTQWLAGGTRHGEIHAKPAVTRWDEHRLVKTEIDSGAREEAWAERDYRASPTALPWKVPEGAYTSPDSFLLTRQAVLATFSRSVASASCQRKQRARFVKPKVKLRSNEGSVLLRGTSGIILPQPAAAQGDTAWMWKRRYWAHSYCLILQLYE